MGEVWSAHDTRLGREVAVKVLPESFAADPDRLRRFELEARAAGSLNHPNLVSVFDVGSEDGTPFLVMELLEGETLRDKAGEGSVPEPPRIPVRKALDYAGQIARGLAVAHDRGIVHRDLKPENVFVTNDGRVKILDFGLARVSAPDDQGSADDRTRQKDTTPGTVLGTAGYMSPEQVRGKPADHRSDIFSYGAILYEMLSGTRAFHGETQADTMSAVLHQDPPELSEVNVPISPALARIVHRCMEKSREERFHSAHDVAFALEAVSGSSSSVSLPAIDKRWRLGVPHAAMAALLALALAVAFFAGRRGHAPRVGAPVSAVLTQLTFQKGAESFPSLAPDGTAFVYTADSSPTNADIYFQRVGGETAINLTKDSPTADGQAAFSPDGQLIAYRSGEGDSAGIYVMGATGEGRRRLTDFGFNPAWTPEGKEIVVATEATFGPIGRASVSALWRVDVSSGRKSVIPTDGDAVQPSVSPNGKRIAFWGLPLGTGKRVLYTVRATGGDRVALNDDDFFNWNPVWSHDGKYLYFATTRGGPTNLWRIAIDEETGKAIGPMEPVTTSSAGITHFSMSKSGAVIFGAGTATWTIDRIAFDAGMKPGPPVALMSGSRDIWQCAPSPDGKWIAIKAFDTQEDILVARSDGAGLGRVTNDRYKDRLPTWRPDSRSVVFFSDRSGSYEVWRIDRDGSNLEQLTRTRDRNTPSNSYVSPDGIWLAAQFNTDPKLTTALIDLRRPIDQRVREWLPRIDERTGFTALAWSPDGTRLAGTGAPAERAGIWIYTLASRTYEKVAERGTFHGWLGTDALAISPDETLMHLDLTTRKQRTIFRFPPDSVDGTFSSDGSAFYLVRRTEERDIWMLRQDGGTGAKAD